MVSAFKILGYKTYGMEEHGIFLYKEILEIFKNGPNTEKLREIYKDVDAVLEPVGRLFWEDLAKAFPDAKVGVACLTTFIDH